MFTELHDEVNVSGKALNCPVHELVGAWEALPCPLHFAARGRELFTALHDWRGHVAIKEHRVKALGVELAVSGTEVSVYDAAVLLDGLSSSIAGGLQSAELHPIQVRGGFTDKGEKDAQATIGAYFQDGLTRCIWGAWSFCTTFMLLVIGDHRRKWEPGGLCSMAGLAEVALRGLPVDNGGSGFFDVKATHRGGFGQETSAPQLR